MLHKYLLCDCCINLNMSIDKLTMEWLSLDKSVLEFRKTCWDTLFAKYENLSQDKESNSVATDRGENDEYADLKNLLLKIQSLAFCRAESLILEDGELDKWNQGMYVELRNIMQYISLDEAHKFIDKSLHNPIPQEVIDLIEYKEKSNLKSSLIERRKYKRDANKRQMITKIIQDEWKRLFEIISYRYLIMYAIKVLDMASESELSGKKGE